MKQTILKSALILFAAIISIASTAFAQDKIFFHNGSVTEGSVVSVTPSTISFTYKGETTEHVIGRYAVERIVHLGSGRVEEISKKVIVNSKSDWESVIILDDKSDVVGLTQVTEVSGSTNWFSQHSADGADEVAIKRIKQKAANVGCTFILITSSTNPHYTLSTNYNSVKKGIAYKY